MRPEKSGLEVDQGDLFRSRLSSILDHRHPLYVLAEAIDWETLEREFGAFYVENVGRPGLATRLMVGLHYLKHLCDQSDESVVEGFIENPYDGHTLKAAHAQVWKITGVKPEDIFVDKGYKGSNHHPEETNVYISGRRLKGTLRKLLRRRSAVEPVIGHLKQDHRMGRNYLIGTEGDRINAMLVGCGFNLRKLLRVFYCLIFKGLETRDWRDIQLRPALSGSTQAA